MPLVLFQESVVGINIELIDTDEMYRNLTRPPVIANDFNLEDPDQNQALNEAFLQHYSSDTIEIDASCQCGEVKGSYNEGLTCPNCGTEVVSGIESTIESDVWIRAPEGIDGSILPEVFIILQKQFTQSSFNYLLWLTDRRYIPEKLSTNDTAVRDRERMEAQFGEVRGLNYFIANFMDILYFITDNTAIVKSVKEREDLKEFCRLNIQYFFPKYLPIPSKLCFVVEKTSSGIYVDKKLNEGIDAVMIMAQTSSPKLQGKHQQINYRVVKAMRQLSIFYENYVKQMLSAKPGIFRKHVYGSRLHFTGRAVITSISDPHHYMDLHIPYGLAVQGLKYHIIGKLARRGFTPNEALGFIHSHISQDCKLMRQILNELIRESPNGRGIPVTLTRNPSLRRGSTQFFYVNVIKEDVDDNTISLSTLVLREPNYENSSAKQECLSDNLSNCWNLLKPNRPLRGESQSHGFTMIGMHNGQSAAKHLSLIAQKQ